MTTTTGRRVLVFSLPFWGHLSTCLGMADVLRGRGDEVSFAFVYPPPGWVLREIAAHGHACEWTLRHVRSALGRPRPDEQRRAVIAAETEMIRAARPDVVLNDVRPTTVAAGRACGVPVVSVLRCPFPGQAWDEERWGDAQLTPHPAAWLRVGAPRVVHCRPAWVRRLTITAAPVEPRPVVASLCTADAQPEHLRLLVAALDGTGVEWVLCYPHPDELAATAAGVVPWADLDGLLAGARVLVCEGGHGTICRGIARGLPVVVLETSAPHSAVYGAGLEAAGAGVMVRRGDQTVPAIRSVVARALHDDRLRAGAAALTRSLAALPEAPEAMDAALASAAGRVSARLAHA